MSSSRSSTRRRTYRQVRVGDVIFDPAFNRPLDKAWVRTLINKPLDKAAVGVIHVSERSNGDLVAIDGQHRVVAVLEKWGPDTRVPGLVEEGLSLAEEADLFHKLNSKRQMQPFDRFRSEHVAKHDEAVQIVKSLDKFGLSYTRMASPKGVAAIVAMEQAYRLGALDDALGLLQDSWGNDENTWNGTLIYGAAQFFSRYSASDVDVRALRHKLATYRMGAEGFLADARAWAALHKVSQSKGAAALMVQVYNHRRSAKSQLQPW